MLRYTFRWRPYRVECAGSVPTSEVKRRRARLVLGWGTAREDLRVLPALRARSLCFGRGGQHQKVSLVLRYTFRWRPYRVECAGSLPTSEVKRRRARLILGEGGGGGDRPGRSQGAASLACAPSVHCRVGLLCFMLLICNWGYGATAARLTPDQKVGSSNLFALIVHLKCCISAMLT